MMIFDQTQAGLGGKESPDLPMGGKPMAIGSCGMFQRFMDQNDGKVIATLWCGDGTFKEDPEKNAKKFAAMAKKFQPDVVICGPCFNYAGYGLMAAKTALTINELVGIPAFAIMSKECEQAIEEYKDKVTKIVSEPDKGMYEALNKGIHLASGDIIGLVHSDDFLYAPNTISKIVTTFQNTNADFVYGNGLFVDPEKTNKVIRNWKSGKYSKWKVKHGWLPLHTTCYIKRSCINKLGLYDESYKIAADSDFLVRYLYEASLKVYYLNEYIVRMRMGGLSTNKKRRKKMWEEDIRMYKSHGFNPTLTKILKMAWKVPQFITAKLKF